MVSLPIRKTASKRSDTSCNDTQGRRGILCGKRRRLKGRWHDHRHTLITDLAESGAGDQTIMDIAGHVSKNMLKHYSHIRMQAKRDALESLVTQPAKPKVSSSKSCSIAEADSITKGLPVLAQ